MQSCIQQSIAHTVHDVRGHQPIYVQSQISSPFQQLPTTLTTHHYASAPITSTQSQAPLIQQDPQQFIVMQQIPQNQPAQVQVTGQGAIPKKLKSHQVSGSIPTEQRDPRRYYCERCPHNYSTKADLKNIMPHGYQIHINIFVQNPNVFVGFTVNEVLQNIIIRSTLTCSHIIVPSSVLGSIIEPIIILTLSHVRVKCVKKRMMCKTPNQFCII